MRKGRYGGKRKKNGEKNGGENGKKKEKKNTDENSGHYVIASSRPPERRPLERRTLAPKLAREEPALYGEPAPGVCIHLIYLRYLINLRE